MNILILGGTSFVGRHLALTAVSRSHRVTLLNRGTHPAPEGTTSFVGDRLSPDGGLSALDGLNFDVVIDTWAEDPRAVVRAVERLRGRVGRYVYISTLSVYDLRSASTTTPTTGVTSPTNTTGTETTGREETNLWNESAPLFDVTAPGASDSAYSYNKRSAEIAIESQSYAKVLLVRPGVILGPHEALYIERGRLPWWLARLSRGGKTAAPAPGEMGIQFVDARDLATFTLDAIEDELEGAFNIISDIEKVTMGQVLEAGKKVTGDKAELVWVSPERIAEVGVKPWTELPLWLPVDGNSYATVYRWDTAKAKAAGLECRPAEATVEDTWEWMQNGDLKPVEAPEGTKGLLGLDGEKEAKLLEGL